MPAAVTGLTNEAIAATAERHFGKGLPHDFVPQLLERVLRHFAAGPLRTVPYAREAVEQAIADGRRVCVASNGEMAKMELTLGRTDLLGLFHGNLFSKDHVKAGKPAPDLFLFAASQMGVLPAHTFVVEDSLAGVLAAVAANMRALAYCRPEDAARFEALGAVTFADMRELPILLREMGS